jgi:membrane associated rhomboid family serine protease
MFIPLGDDNSDRRIRPVVNYTLIAINLLVFFFLQGLGQNYQFTYAFSTVPQEILTGQDIVTEDRIVADPASARGCGFPDYNEHRCRCT